MWSAGLVTTIGLTVRSYISQCSICICSPDYVCINRHSTEHSTVYNQTRCKPGQPVMEQAVHNGSELV